MSSRLQRVRDGVVVPIAPSEFMAWKEVSGNIVYPFEYGILNAMDRAYCEAMETELADYRARREAQAEADASAKGHRGR